jgi:pimeloyl-ACP methyl ester carboxylesterase
VFVLLAAHEEQHAQAGRCTDFLAPSLRVKAGTSLALDKGMGQSSFDSVQHPGRLTGKSVTVMGTEIYYEEVGAGHPVILLHGLNDSHRTWRKVVPFLARTHRVLIPDLPGCGLSARPDVCYSLDWQASVMNAWLDTLSLKTVDIVGHSYGGGVAQYMLLLHATRVRRLALIAAGGMGRDVAFVLRLASLPRVVETFGQPFMAPVATRFLRGVGAAFSPEDSKWLASVNARPGTARAFARTVRDVIDWRGQRRHFLDRAREIHRFPPTALFWGTRDRIIPHTHALASLEVLRGAQLTTFPDCGHFVHHEQPRALSDALLKFLDAPHAQPVLCAAPEPRAPWQERARRLFSAARAAQPAQESPETLPAPALRAVS